MVNDKAPILLELQRMVPAFHPDENDVREELTYMVINDFGRYICEKASATSLEEVKQAVDALESLISEGDQNVKDLVRDCLWGLLECPESDKITLYFGPGLRKLKKQLPST